MYLYSIKNNKHFQSCAHGLWKASGLMGLLSLSIMSGESAQYNFHLNSVEQGANSVANPVLSINGSKVEKTGEKSTEGASQTFSNASPQSTDVVPVSSVSTQVSSEVDETRYFRFGVSALQGNVKSDGKWNQDHNDKATLDVVGQLGVYPISYLGFNAFGGGFSHSKRNKYLLGGEVHLIPVKMDIFGMRDLLEIGVMGGIWNLVPETSPNKHWATPFLGAKASLNFGRTKKDDPRWGLVSSIRANQNIATADLGLAYKF